MKKYLLVYFERSNGLRLVSYFSDVSHLDCTQIEDLIDRVKAFRDNAEIITDEVEIEFYKFLVNSLSHDKSIYCNPQKLNNDGEKN